jgi:hypothetical protein
MPLLVTGKTDSRMKTNATSVRCGDESLSKRDRRVKTQLLVEDRENSWETAIVTGKALTSSVPYGIY